MTRTIPGHVDSVGKLLERVALVAKEKIYYQGKPIKRTTDAGAYEVEPPEQIYLSPSLLRRFACHVGCTACCLPFTLDFTNDEFNSFVWKEDVDSEAIGKFETRILQVNGKEQPIQTYKQYLDDSCPFLRPTRDEGALGCGFWTEDNSTQPLECAAAPQLLMTTRGQGATVLMKRPFGRGWAWKDKPQCEFDPVADSPGKIDDDFDLSNEIMLLERYNHWAEYLEIETYIPEILDVLPNLAYTMKSEKYLKMVPVLV